MSRKQETPAPQRRQAEGDTGVTSSEASVPGWARKRAGEALLRFQGRYTTPEQLYREARDARKAAAAKGVGRGMMPARGDRSRSGRSHEHTGAGGSPTPENPATHPVNRSPLRAVIDAETGELLPWSAAPPEAQASGADGSPLPCRSLVTTQSNGRPEGLTGTHRRVASALAWNVAHVCEKFGIAQVGFLTLTFADHVTDVREASRRFNSLASNVLKKRYGHYIRVLERQKSGRIHYHLLVVLPDDIRTGADFDAFARRDYKSANNHLRREWAFWRKTAPLYRFGRTELMPIRSNGDALGQYVGKYIGKHMGQRQEEDKGARLVSYSGEARMATSKHMALQSHSTEWRAKCETFSRIVSAWKPHARIRTTDDLAFHLGPRWSYKFRDFILRLPPADLSVPF